MQDWKHLQERGRGGMAKKPHKYTRLLRFDSDTRKRIIARDHGICIFCAMGYPADGDAGIYDIMHFIPKSAMGLGVERNGALGCRYHHHQLDNGNKGMRAEMLEKFESYLRGIYPDWCRDELVYSKFKQQ